jgi:6,7-dimethyl-8-ribityllumazine synthase
MSKSTPTLAMPSFDKPVKLLIVAADQHRAVSEVMVAGAQAALTGIDVEVIWMPSIVELASAIALAERMAQFDGYLALGAVFDTDAQAKILLREVVAALGLLGLQGAAVGTGVVLAEDSEQARDFAASKGAHAAAAALHLIALSRKWATDTKGIGFRP